MSLLVWNMFFTQVSNCKTLKSNITSNIQIYILQPWTIVAKSFMSLVTRLVDLPLIKNSAAKLKFCWKTKSFTNALVKLKELQEAVRYTVYSTCVHVYSECSKILQNHMQKNHLKAPGSCSKINSFTGTSLGKYELGWLNNNFMS